MSAVQPNPVAAAATSTTMDQVKHFAIDSANWIGRQVNVLFNTTKGFAAKAAEFAKPYFSSFMKFAGEMLDKAKENREFCLGGVAALAAAALVLTLYNACSNKEEAADTALATPAITATPATTVAPDSPTPTATTAAETPA